MASPPGSSRAACCGAASAAWPRRSATSSSKPRDASACAGGAAAWTPAPGLSAIIASCLENASTPRRAGRTPVGISAGVDEVASLAQSGDPGVSEALAAGAGLGRGGALVCAILDPRIVVLGGHCARPAPWILSPARESFRGALLMPAPEHEQLEVSGLNAWAPAEAAALAALLTLTDGTRALP